MNQVSFLRRVACADYGIFSRNWQASDENGKSASISSILLMSFNMASAGLLILTILFDVWRLSRRNVSVQVEKPCRFLHWIRPGEVVTLSISAAVIIQGFVFVGVQSTEMYSSAHSNCSKLGEVLFPAMWLVGSVILAFGIETLYRGFQRTRFAPQKKASIYICWAAALFLVFMLWIPTQARRSTLDTCSSKLLAVAIPWSNVAFGASIALIVSYILIASILATQLFRAGGVDPKGRIAASQMIYYLAIATLVFIFFLPLWTRMILDIPEGITYMMAMVSINVIGIAISLFQLLFRSYTDSMTIGFSGSPRSPGDRKFSGSWKGVIKNDISAPIAIQQDEVPFFGGIHDDPHSTGGIVNGMNIDKSLPPTPRIKNPKYDTYNKTHYSVFPAKSSATHPPKHPPSSIYEDDMFLAPPRPPFAAGHNRNSSDISHATVQIGLRLSNLDPPPAESSAAKHELGSFLTPWAQDATNHLSATSLDVPVTLRSPAVERPTVPFPQIIPSRLRSSTLPSSTKFGEQATPNRNTPIMTPTGSPAVYRKLDDLQKLLDVDLRAAQQAATYNESWPLRDSLPVLLPKKTYHPDND